MYSVLSSFKDKLLELFLALFINDIFDFRGYVSRKDYILTAIYTNTIFLPLILATSYISNVITYILLFWLFVAITSLNIRRYRDAERSPWWTVALYAPIIMIVSIALISADTLFAIEVTAATLGIPFLIAFWFLFGKSEYLGEEANEEERILIIVLTTIMIALDIRFLMFLSVGDSESPGLIQTIDQNIKIEQTYNTPQLKLDQICQNIYEVRFADISEEEKIDRLDESMILAEKISSEGNLLGGFDIIYHTDMSYASIWMKADIAFDPTADILAFCYENSSLTKQ